MRQLCILLMIFFFCLSSAFADLSNADNNLSIKQQISMRKEERKQAIERRGRACQSRNKNDYHQADADVKRINKEISNLYGQMQKSNQQNEQGKVANQQLPSQSNAFIMPAKSSDGEIIKQHHQHPIEHHKSERSRVRTSVTTNTTFESGPFRSNSRTYSDGRTESTFTIDSARRAKPRTRFQIRTRTY
ncbi:hypothetical protein A3F08_02540 [Candidatus Berkelbacteria bacterium RIFCSPHIGHO2_12_FULL_36_9]|uniref:BZIP domain-containing protein n=1 Tax=Candidatus Berkelbacteria bacterium RIFCSPHIGHO2_12_FULL_36_9 TaxID=1797469 RepID=A0A1F5EFU7_9BACT|nr:MAG: hypothetical protein A3F08_02540 [Candidatus Berkelbacteria bacterium RIFCSPHIGHO2_12_FULL_36_9]